MTKAASYFTAAVPEPCRVLGLLLKPFSLGHYLILSRFNSAFVDEGPRDATRDEVVFAVLVCHFTYGQFFDFIAQKDFAAQVKAWGKQQGVFSIKEKAAILQKYISEASEMPGFVFEEEGSKSGAHWAQTVKVAVVGHCGYTHDEAMNAPLRQVLADFLKHAESNGAVTILSDEEMEQIKSLDEAEKN